MDNIEEIDDDLEKDVGEMETFEALIQNMKYMTKPKYKYEAMQLMDAFRIAKSIDKELFWFCKEKIPKIVQFAYDNDYVKDKWSAFGYCLWILLDAPDEAENLDLPKELKDFALEQFEHKSITMVKTNGVDTIVFSDEAERLSAKETLRDTLFSDMLRKTKPYNRENLQSLIGNLFKFAKKIDDDVYEFCSKKLDIMFEHIFTKNLKPENIYWKDLGHYMWQLLYNPYKTEKIPLSQELIDYIRNEFEWKRITLEKVDGKNTVIFAKNSC